MINIVKPIIDKLTIQYKLKLSEFNNLICMINNLYNSTIRIIDSKRQDPNFLFSKNIKSKDNPLGYIYFNFCNSWIKPLNKDDFLSHDFFVSFNPSKINKELINIVRFIHSFLNRKWVISTIDLAFDINQPMSNILIFAPNRKMRNILDTIYFGKRNSDGSLKMYDKAAELQGKQKRPLGNILTRIEYTYKPTKTNRIPYQLNINKFLKKRYTIHLLSKLEPFEKHFFTENKNTPLNKLSKKSRLIIKELKEKSYLSIHADELRLLKQICHLLNDKNTYKILWKFIDLNGKNKTKHILLSHYRKFNLYLIINLIKNKLIKTTFKNPILLFSPMLC